MGKYKFHFNATLKILVQDSTALVVLYLFLICQYLYGLSALMFSLTLLSLTPPFYCLLISLHCHFSLSFFNVVVHLVFVVYSSCCARETKTSSL